MLDTAQPGNYTMRVEGTMNGGQGGNIFENETDIMFSIKRVSTFITLSKPIYNQGQEGEYWILLTLAVEMILLILLCCINFKIMIFGYILKCWVSKFNYA